MDTPFSDAENAKYRGCRPALPEMAFHVTVFLARDSGSVELIRTVAMIRPPWRGDGPPTSTAISPSTPCGTTSIVRRSGCPATASKLKYL